MTRIVLMTGIKKFVIQFILSVFVFLLVATSRPIFAAGPELSLYPDSGYAILNKDFSVDIMLDTGGEETNMTRAVFRFDPEKVTVVKAQHGDLYCGYPEEDYAVDNTDGWVMLTGFCQDPYYKSDSTPGLFGRITFRPLVEGEVEFTFEFEGEDDDWNSVIMKAGSPPENVLMTAPEGGKYTVVTSLPQDGGTSTGKLPGVGIFENKTLLLGISLFALSLLVLVIDVVVVLVKRNAQNANKTVIIN